MRSILQAGRTGDSLACRSISSPALGALALPSGIVQGSRFFKQGALEICQFVGDRRIPGVSPPHVLRSLITVLCGPQGFLWANSFWSLLQPSLVAMIPYFVAISNPCYNTLWFIAISLSLAATTIKSLQYNNHIAIPLVCVAISKLPFPTTWYASQHICFHLQ